MRVCGLLALTAVLAVVAGVDGGRKSTKGGGARSKGGNSNTPNCALAYQHVKRDKPKGLYKVGSRCLVLQQLV
jgi:hypothetical protein